jgi:hypothetical protein
LDPGLLREERLSLKCERKRGRSYAGGSVGRALVLVGLLDLVEESVVLVEDGVPHGSGLAEHDPHFQIKLLLRTNTRG